MRLPIFAALLLASGCASPKVYENNTAVSEHGCGTANTQAGRYRCEGWAMLSQASKVNGPGGERFQRAGAARIQIADALDAGGMNEAQAATLARNADVANGIPVPPPKPDTNDPLEPYNRAMFKVDMALDRALIKPAAKTYRTVLPGPVRGSVRNALDNLEGPVVLGNSLLQANWNRAGKTAGRFVVNSTVGVAGLFDPATKMGLPRYDEDFGQTLGVWGVGEGPYLVWPVIGPRPPRDAAGLVVDHFMNPLTYVTLPGGTLTSVGIRGLDVIDKRSRRIETVDQLQRTSLDFYATVRSLYRQRRQAQILNQDTAEPGTPGAPAAAPVSAQDFEFEDQQAPQVRQPSNSPSPNRPAQTRTAPGV